MNERCIDSNLTRRLHEDICTCLICYQPYDNKNRVPRLLECGHTLCTFCLDELCTRVGTLNCPFCTQQVKKKSRNFTILNLLDILRNVGDINGETKRQASGVTFTKGKQRRVTFRMTWKEYAVLYCIIIHSLVIALLVTMQSIIHRTNSNPAEFFATCSGPFDVYLSQNSSLLSSYPLSNRGQVVKSCDKDRPVFIFSGILGNQTYGKLGRSTSFDLEISFMLYDVPQQNEKFFEFGFVEMADDNLSNKTHGWYVYKDKSMDDLQLNKVNSLDPPKTYQMPVQFAHEYKTIYRITLMPNEQKILLLKRTTTGWDIFDVISYMSTFDFVPFFTIHREKTAKISMNLKSSTRLGFNARTKSPSIYIDSKNTTISNEMLQPQLKTRQYTNVLSAPINCSSQCYIPLSVLFEDLQAHAVPLLVPLLELRLQKYTRGSEQGFGNEILKLTLKRCVEYGWTWTYYHTYCLEYAQQNGQIEWINVHTFDWIQIAFFVDMSKDTVSAYSQYVNLLTGRNVTLEGDFLISLNVTISKDVRVQLKTEKENLRWSYIALYKIVNLISMIFTFFKYFLYFVFMYPYLLVANCMSYLFRRF